MKVFLLEFSLNQEKKLTVKESITHYGGADHGFGSRPRFFLAVGSDLCGGEFLVPVSVLKPRAALHASLVLFRREVARSSSW